MHFDGADGSLNDEGNANVIHTRTNNKGLMVAVAIRQ